MADLTKPSIKHLKATLKKLLINSKLDLIVLSHIDNDHVIGLLDLLADIKEQIKRERRISEDLEIMAQFF